MGYRVSDCRTIKEIYKDFGYWSALFVFILGPLMWFLYDESMPRLR